jgi:hypothetical protein
MRPNFNDRWQPLPWVALGLVAGVSFLAQPVKFLTPSLSVAELVSVGATIFRGSHAMQWALLLLMAAVMPASKSRPRRAYLLLGAFALALALQQWGLIPALDARLALMQAGKTPTQSLHHGAYVGLELGKLLVLFMLGRMPSRITAERQTLGDAL